MGSERTEPRKIHGMNGIVLLVPAYLELKTCYRESKFFNISAVSPKFTELKQTAGLLD